MVQRAATYRYGHVLYLKVLPLARDGLRFEGNG
jgi:hypothetical protein